MKKMRCISFFLILFVFCCFMMPVYGNENGSRKTLHNVPRVTSKIKVDGILNEKIWQEALVLNLNYETDPGDNIEPPVKTEVLVAYGPNHLYVGFRAYDPNPGEIRARLTDRDHISDDDYVGIHLDTFNEQRRSYNFEVNPYGVQADRVLLLSILGGEEWDAIWNSAGKIHDKGYNVEIAIPFTSLRFQKIAAGETQVWGFNAVRHYPRNVSHSINLIPINRGDNCYMCQMDKVKGFAGAKPGKSFELDPTLTAVYTQERSPFPGGDFKEKTKDIEAGISAHWNITNNMMVSATINPDFSQVEADSAQLDVNTQFALYYPEKRPFFLEGNSLYITNLFAVYTRTIADPIWGAKLTGKTGKHGFAFFSVRDNITNLIFPGSFGSTSTSLDMNNQSSALRYRLDVGKASNVGVLFTDREGDEYFNRIASIDADLRLTKIDRVILQYIGSQTQYPDHIAAAFNQPMGSFWGHAYTAMYQHTTKNYMLFLRHQNIWSKFRADLGFVPQSDFIFYRVGAQYYFRKPPGHWYTLLHLHTRYDNEKDHAGNLIFHTLQGWVRYYGPMQSYLSIEANVGKQTYQGIEYDNDYLTLEAGLRPTGSLYMKVISIFGDRIDYDNGRSGSRVKINPLIQFKAGSHLNLELDHVYERLKVAQGRLYTANLTNLKMIYQFNRRAFIRAILQYANYDYNAPLYSYAIDPQFKHLFSQFLFSYKINPRTVLFLGYSDDYYGYKQVDLQQSNRTFFLKLGYALRM